MKRFLPLACLLLGALYLASTLRDRTPTAPLDLRGFGRVPVLVNGRIKPLDTVARTSLLMIQGRQRLVTPDGRTLLPVEWLADVMFAPDKADTYQHFLIENHEVLDLMKLKVEDGAGKKRFSYAQLRDGLPELDRQARLAEPTEPQLRNPFQKQVISVRDRVILYLQLKNSVQLPDSPDFLTELMAMDKALPAGLTALQAKRKGEPHSEDAVKAMREMADRFTYLEQMGYLRTIPPAPGDPDPTHWQTTGQALMGSFGSGRIDPTALAYAVLGHAWRKGDASQFNEVVTIFHDKIAERYPEAMRKSDVEARFNTAAPFYSSLNLYVLAFLLAVASWLVWPQELARGAFYVTLLAFIATTAGIAARMWIGGYAPVTNLYSSALGVGWGAVALCLVLERYFRNGIGSAAGGFIGFATLIIAHFLSLTSTDTMEMMRAVLDSNFWLATHVVVITLGYSATYLAGFLAIVYIFRGLLTRSLDRGTADALTRMVYGIVCFATLFSLVGTVLGGIWADQSWGRFWGWDPKENGALIIVIWNAVILHARWGGMVKQRGLMAMAVFGNVVTSWSWFGTNMLGVGLHSYGFMDAAFYWLIGFVLSQLAIIALALVPLEKWRSFAGQPAAA